MWEILGRTGPVFRQQWPKYDPELEKEDAAEVVLQVNGKLRGEIRVANSASQADIKALAVEHSAVRRFLEGRPAKRVIVVPGKLVNVVG
jgi:leucyl-tRNA synthetase